MFEYVHAKVTKASPPRAPGLRAYKTTLGLPQHGRLRPLYSIVHGVEAVKMDVRARPRIDEGNEGASSSRSGLRWALEVLEKHETDAAKSIQRAYRNQ